MTEEKFNLEMTKNEVFVLFRTLNGINLPGGSPPDFIHDFANLREKSIELTQTAFPKPKEEKDDTEEPAEAKKE